MKSKILVTGGAGYIGSKIASDLIKQNYEVVIIDNLSTGHISSVNKKAIFFKFSIGNKKKLTKIFQKYKIKSVIHCAASLNINESETKPKKYFINNVINTSKLLDVCSNYRINNFILSSTAAVYGKVKGKVKENFKPKPISVYGKTKLQCEMLVKDSAKKHKFNYGILRYFNVAGSDIKNKLGCINKNNQLFKNLSLASLSKKKIIFIYGNNYKTDDGTCIRDYISINDLSLIHCKLLKIINKKNKSYLLNCGYGQGFSVLQIVNNFEKVAKIKFKKIFLPRREGDVVEIFADVRKINKVLNLKFCLKNKLKSIIKSCLDWEKYLNEKK